MTRSVRLWMLIPLLFGVRLVAAQDVPSAPKLSAQELAQWIDDQFAAVWQASDITPPPVVDDATFLKRAYLDLSGTIPPVSQAREFLEYNGDHKRRLLVERLLNETRRPERHAERSAAHWATLWRRMMVPGNSPEAQMAVGLEPWLKEQFAANVRYDEMVRTLVTARSSEAAPMVRSTRTGQMAAGGPTVFFQAVGGKPESAASSVTRMFLGVRVGCAECHDHPFAEWKQKDFWGMAAFFNGVRNGAVEDSSKTTIRPENSAVEYAAMYLGGESAKIASGRTPRQELAAWMVSPRNTQFAATAVNRVWLHLVGRGLTDSVDDLDRASPEERKFLDDLAKLFIAAGYDLRWLMTGICQSQVYQRECVALADDAVAPPPGLRVVKTLTPEQVFNSLEQALSLPISRVDGSARYNGLRDQLVARMNEAATTNPDEYRAGIPQALLMINGRLTTEATDLEQSRTLRGVLEAPFMDTEEKLLALYLATFSRPPRVEEREYLLNYLRQSPEIDKQKQAHAEIFWGLLNSPEFVLEK
jgi:hypothetical protein